MGIIYDALLNGLKKVEKDNHVIVDRNQAKVQEVSLKRFLFFSNALEAANVKLANIKGKYLSKSDEQYKARKKDAKTRLEGEKKLAQLRKFNDIFTRWEKSLKPGNIEDSNLKELKKGQKKLDKVIAGMSQLKESIGKDKIDLQLFEEVSNIDKQQFQDLAIAINTLKERRELIKYSIVIKEGKALSPEQAKVLARIQKNAGPSLKNASDNALKNASDNALKEKLYQDSARLKKMRNELNVLLEKENPELADEILGKVKEYEALHASISKDLDSGVAGPIARLELLKLIQDRTLIGTILMTNMRAKIEVANRDAKALLPSLERHNKEAVDIYKSLLFYKKLEKLLLVEEIKIREEERRNAYDEIEKNEPKIKKELPDENLLNELEDPQREALLQDHRRKVEDFDRRRDEIVSAAKDRADKVIDSDFGYTFVESKVLDLQDFPYVKAYAFYQEGKPGDAGRQIWSFLSRQEGKAPSKKEFEDASKDVFGEKLDPSIYEGLLKEYHSKKGALKGELVWNEWIVKQKTIPTFEQFSEAFKEKVGVEPLRENFDRLEIEFKEKGIPQEAKLIWKQHKNPNWEAFKAEFKRRFGIEPDKSLYLKIVDDEIKQKEEDLRAQIEQLRRFAPMAKEEDTWFAKGDKTLKDLLKRTDQAILDLTDRFEKFTENNQASRDLKNQLDEAVLLKANIENLLKSPERTQIRLAAQNLANQLEALKKLKED